MAVTETWLAERDLDSELVIDGFGVPLHMDRDAQTTGKTRGGGVCLYINECWCKTVVVRESLCTKDMELLTVSLRLHYLPWEFPQIFVTVVYIHPNVNELDAAETLSNVTHRLQSLSPDAPNIILGDFNNCTMLKSLRNFYQYVTCPTRYNKTLDLCFWSVKGVYKSIPLPQLTTAACTLSRCTALLCRGEK